MNISQGNVATRLKRSGIYYYHFTGNLLQVCQRTNF